MTLASPLTWKDEALRRRFLAETRRGPPGENIGASVLRACRTLGLGRIVVTPGAEGRGAVQIRDLDVFEKD